MPRELSAGFADAIVQQTVHVAFAVQFDFDSGITRLWTGVGTLAWNAQSWFGVGQFGGISPIEEASDVSARGITLSLSGIPSSLISLALAEPYRGRKVTLWTLVTDDTGTSVLYSYESFSGKLDTMTIEDHGDTSVIKVTAENEFLDFERAPGTRYTNEEQQRRFAGDLFFDRTAVLSEKPLYWGVAPSTVPTGAGKEPPLRFAPL